MLIEAEAPTEVSQLLRDVAAWCELHWVCVPADRVVASWTDLRAHLTSNEPTLLHLEAGDWISSEALIDAHGLPRDPWSVSHLDEEFRHQLLEDLRALPSTAPVIVVVAVRRVEHLAATLRQPGAFDRYVAAPRMDNEAVARCFIAQCQGVGFDASVDEEIETLGALLRKVEPRERDLLAHHLQRRAKSVRTPVSFQDLLWLHAFGIVDQDVRPGPSHLRWRTAVHEAGHVLAEYLRSRGRHVALLATILPRRGSLGYVLPASEVAWSDEVTDVTLEQYWLDIDIGLGGRAAEHVMLGIQGISAHGSRTDLRQVSERVLSILAWNGLPASMDPDEAGTNLMVMDPPRATPPNFALIVRGRHLLEERYDVLVEAFEAHRDALHAVAEALMAAETLHAPELRAILRAKVGFEAA